MFEYVIMSKGVLKILDTLCFKDAASPTEMKYFATMDFDTSTPLRYLFNQLLDCRTPSFVAYLLKPQRTEMKHPI